MRDYSRKLLDWFKALFAKLIGFFVPKSQRKLLNKKPPETRPEKYTGKPYSSSGKVESPDDQVTQQPAPPAEKTSQKPLNYPSMPRRELLIDKPFESAARGEQTTTPTASRQRESPVTPLPQPLSSRNEEPYSPSVKVKPPDEQATQQPAPPFNIETSQKPLNYPPMPSQELLTDRPFEPELEGERTNSPNFPMQREATVSPITPQPSSTRNKTQRTDTFSRERPYIQCGTDELKRIANLAWNNPKILIEIHYELQFRSRRGAQDLLDRISKRLTKLQSPETFVWPHTTVRTGSGAPASDLPPIDTEKGVLALCGYKVGRNGLSENQRRQILNNVFLHPLPPMNNVSYLNEWGQPETAKRLKKLANAIAAFTRNAKRKNRHTFAEAIQDWESDLAYLKRTYYDERFNFDWPRTRI